MTINAIRRFLAIKNSGRPIPHHVLRDYLDALLLVRKEASGLHNKTITITKGPIGGILHWDVMLETDTEIRVEGARWK